MKQYSLSLSQASRIRSDVGAVWTVSHVGRKEHYDQRHVTFPRALRGLSALAPSWGAALFLPSLVISQVAPTDLFTHPQNKLPLSEPPGRCSPRFYLFQDEMSELLKSTTSVFLNPFK